MFKKILIANRGEIALRIIRSCRVMGIQTVAVYSEGDADMLHVKLADEAFCIGGNDPKSSYLNIFSILSAATLSGAEAIHPGYGFLSENEDFQSACQRAGIVFIGPSSDSFSILGDKGICKAFMKANGIPTVPGSKESLSSVEEAIADAEKIGYPVLLKASFGGGGRGIRRADSKEDLIREYPLVQKEAKLAFGKEDLYLEKLIVNPRHIEVQILRDSFGNAVSLYERECSLQRKNQKLLEEAPSSFVDSDLRRSLSDCAVKIANITNYLNAGTIEFLMDEQKNYYFMEMNTRIQVEHPVTEMITGIDIVKEQIRIAAGLALPFRQEEVPILGHAVEIRVNAENPAKNFAPCPGRVRFFSAPAGFHVRFDSFLTCDTLVSPYYDSMVGKLIVLGKTRLEAIRRARAAIEETIIDGIETNLALQYTLLHDPDVIQGKIHTGFMDQKLPELLERMKI